MADVKKEVLTGLAACKAEAAKERKGRGGKSGGAVAAAVRVLTEAGEGAEMSPLAIVTEALEKGYWESNGKTPWQTLQSHITAVDAKSADPVFEKGTKAGTYRLRKRI